MNTRVLRDEGRVVSPLSAEGDKEFQLAVDALGFEMVGLDQESFVQRGGMLPVYEPKRIIR